MFPIQSSSVCLPPLNGADEQKRAIVSTLLYYDLFAYPLCTDELVRFVHRDNAAPRLALCDIAPASDWWSSSDGYWFLRGREHLVDLQAERQRVSTTKLAHARRWARSLQRVPGVRFIGVTGSLSMHSATPEDDIDLLIITARGRLWLTRALVLTALWAMRVKRADDGQPEHPNQACANIFLSEDDLALPDHNLFIAHEICQLLPLLGPQTYRRFLNANNWVKGFLPQWEPATDVWQDRRDLHWLQRAVEATLGPIGDTLEHEAMRRQLTRIQSKHARGHNPDVKLSPTQLRFHPRDISQYIVGEFEARWNALNAVPVKLKVPRSSLELELAEAR
jgi:nucleotide-binding universal stress UspA family protein